MDAVVSRLHHALAEALRAHRAGREEQPVSVAEIYQELVPYRHVRSAIGVEMNADYEYALLRLLAGEGSFARIEPAEAREALRLEIGSPNPNVTLYRKYAGCDVYVDLDRPSAPLLTVAPAATPYTFEPADGGSAPGTPGAHGQALPLTKRSSPFVFSEIEDAGRAGLPGARAAQDTTKVAESDPLEDVNFAATPDSTFADHEFDDLAPETQPSCLSCNGSLPAGRKVNFCPHCGADQRRLICNACGEDVDKSWRFCPACGATVADRAGGGA